MKEKNTVPKSLRTWFLIHFIVDMIFAIPLIFFPTYVLNLLGFTSTGSELVTARLVGAALIGIGGASFFNYKNTSKESKESYNIMLTLKILWSIAAIIALLISALNGAPKSIWLIIITFAIFSGIWQYYKIRINK